LPGVKPDACALDIRLKAIGQASDHVDHFTSLHSPVFLLNSRSFLLFATLCEFTDVFMKHHGKNSKAHLLPKLQRQIAEFLKYYYLNILVYATNLPVSV